MTVCDCESEVHVYKTMTCHEVREAECWTAYVTGEGLTDLPLLRLTAYQNSVAGYSYTVSCQHRGRCRERSVANI